MNGENEIPRGWSRVRVRDKYAFTNKPEGRRLNSFDKVAFIPMDLVPIDKLSFSDFVLKEPDAISSGTYFEDGDLLVSKITPCFENGKQGIARNIPNGFGVATTEVIPVKAVEGESEVEFLAYVLLDHEVRHTLAEKMEGATGRQRLSKTVLQEWEILYPPKKERLAIVSLLSRIQFAIELQDKTISTLKDLKAATMGKLFHEGLRGEKLKETDIGEIPRSWDTAVVGSIQSKVNYGTSTHCTTELRGRPVLRIPNVVGGGIDASDLKYADLPENEVDRFALEEGDLLFVRTNGNKDYLGRCAVYHGAPAGAMFASYLIRIRLEKDTVLPDFAQHFISSVGKIQITSKANPAADGKFNIDTGILKSVVLPRPSIVEQEEILEILDELDARLQVAEGKRSSLASIFSSSLHLLMTGRVRVTPLLEGN